MNGKVLVFGSINTDLVTYLERLPRTGETVTGGTFETHPGGKGANQAVAAARAGARVELYGFLGEDAFGRERLSDLERASVDTSHVTLLPGVSSGIAQILVDAKGENVIAVAPGANFRYSRERIALPQCPADERWIALFQNEIPQEISESLIGECSEKGMMTIWNPSPLPQRPPSPETFRALDFIMCNALEAEALTGVADFHGAAEELAGRGVRSVLITLGSRGAYLLSGSESMEQPAFPVKPLDTVGAGDCFSGVFAASLAAGASEREAMETASAAAAVSITRKGAQSSMPSGEEIQAFRADMRSRTGSGG